MRAKTNAGYGSYTDVIPVILPLVIEPPMTNTSENTYDLLSGGGKAAIVTATFFVLILVAVTVVFIIGGIKYKGLKKSHRLPQ